LGKHGNGTGLNAGLMALCDGLHFKRVPGWHSETKYSLAAGDLPGEVSGFLAPTIYSFSGLVTAGRETEAG